MTDPARPEVMTLEQEARDLLERIGVKNAQLFTSGDLVELANLIGKTKRRSKIMADQNLRQVPNVEGMPLLEAISVLRNHGFDIANVKRMPCKPRDIVTGHFHGALPRGFALNILVSEGCHEHQDQKNSTTSEIENEPGTQA